MSAPRAAGAPRRPQASPDAQERAGSCAGGRHPFLGWEQPPQASSKVQETCPERNGEPRHQVRSKQPSWGVQEGVPRRARLGLPPRILLPLSPRGRGTPRTPRRPTARVTATLWSCSGRSCWGCTAGGPCSALRDSRVTEVCGAQRWRRAAGPRVGMKSRWHRFLWALAQAHGDYKTRSQGRVGGLRVYSNDCSAGVMLTVLFVCYPFSVRR